jgi:Spy/CpxP family protein refolding chaperone
MKTGWKILFVTGAVLAVLSSQALAQPGWGPGRPRGRGMGFGPQARGPVGRGGGGLWCPLGPGMGAGRMLGPLAWRLDLTDEQMEKIRDIHQQARADANEAEKAVADAREALHKAVTEGAGEEQIRAAAAALGTAIGNQAALHAKTRASVQAVLTEGQRKEMEKIREEIPPRGRGARGPGFGGPPGGRRGARPQAPGPRGPRPGGRPAGDGTSPLEQIFKAADADKDGVLTMKELQAFQEQTRGNRPLRR